MSGTTGSSERQSDREILIELRSDVQHLTHAFSTFVEEQKICNRDIDVRMRDIEIKGSRPAAENVKHVKELSARVDSLEEFVDKHTATQIMVEKTSTRIAGWVSLSIAIVGILISLAVHFLK